MKRLSLLALILTVGIYAKAQSELTLPFMPGVFQSSFVNPTVIPEHTFSMGYSIYTQVVTNGFVPNNVLIFRDDTMHFDPNLLLDDLRDKNLFYMGENTDIFHIRTKILNGYYWFAIRQRMESSFFYPYDLFRMVIEGNEPYIGQTLDFSNLKIFTSLFNEYSFGMTKEYPHWIFGGRLSLLQGLSNINFNPTRLSIKVEDEMYGQLANADAQLRTSGIPKDGNGDPSFDHVEEPEWITDYFTNFKNKGFALSGGATYRYDDRTRISLSFRDVGFITWKDSIETYTLNGNTNFTGLDIMSDLLYGNDVEVDSIFENILDEDFHRDTIYNKYTTWLNPKFNLTASYDLARRTTVGFSFSGVVNQKLYTALTLSLSQGIGRFFSIVGTASINQRSFTNLGLGLMLKPGPLQIFVVADNLYAAHNPLTTTNFNIRVGVNLVFGRINQPEGLPFR